jgi:transposase-like protein
MELTLASIYQRFPTSADCLRQLEIIYWNGKPRCPYCASLRHTPLAKENRYHCNGCNTSYSVTAQTVFRKTRVDLQKWFWLITYMINEEREPSARKLAELIGVDKNTACFMTMRVRIEMVRSINYFLNIAEGVSP